MGLARLVVLAGVSVIATATAAEGQIQEAKLVPSTPTGGGNFGGRVALDGRTAVVAQPPTNKAIVFERIGGAWHETQVLTLVGQFAEARTLDLSGDWLAVGSPFDDAPSLWSGSVSVFQRQGGTWVPKQKLVPPPPQNLELFGWDVRINDRRLIIGAPGTTGTNWDEGAAFVFELEGSTWKLRQKLVASTPHVDAEFGRAVAIDGNTALVCAAGYDARPDIAGAAYIFELTNGSWLETQKLVPSTSRPGDTFGLTAAIDASTAMVSGVGWLPPYGNAVFVFEKGVFGWQETQVLKGFNPTVGGTQGPPIALSQDTMVIGSWSDNDLGGPKGAAFHFRRQGQRWTQIGKLLPTNPTVGCFMGWSVALSGETVIAGAPQDDGAGFYDSGAAFVFNLGPDAIQYCSCPNGPCFNHDAHGGCKNSTKQGAVLQACGSGSASIDDLRVESRWMPKGVPGLVIMGPRPEETPYGDGILCLGAGDKGLFRFPGGNSGLEGVITLGPGIVAYSHANFPMAGHIQPGDTWYFQAWYRDPTGPCGSGFNLSNGLKVEFTQ